MSLEEKMYMYFVNKFCGVKQKMGKNNEIITSDGEQKLFYTTLCVLRMCVLT